MPKPVNIHASCVALGRKGVLILGASGTGKSDLALRLIDDGAKLVADDRTDLYEKSGALHAHVPRSIAGLLEVRGLGVIACPYRPSVRIYLAACLEGAAARLPEREFYAPPAPFKGLAPVPLIRLKAGFPSAPARIRLALAAVSKGLFREDFNPT